MADDTPAQPSAAVAAPALAAATEAKTPLLETKCYLHLLVVMTLLDQGFKQQAADNVAGLVQTVQSANRRTLDLISAKLFFYYTLANELLGKLAEIRSTLLMLHRTACLQHNEPGQAVLINCVLRSFLSQNLYAQADKFRLNTNFPESRSSQQHARYLYYLGRINAVQLQYSDAFANLTQALRKAPQRAAVGFRVSANKLLIIVQLLMGDIPERATFKQAGLKKALLPYLKLTQAARVGDLAAFKDLMKEYEQQFVKDGVNSLIVRLRANVIKTGLRKITLSYSRISIRDVCDKLHLDNEEDAEYIVAKAIHDGVIDAVIDREKRYLYSKENVDVYSTEEPQAAFHKRFLFCNDIHNQAVKALRFPPNAYKVAPEQLRDDTEEDIEKDLSDEDLDMDDKDKK